MSMTGSANESATDKKTLPEWLKGFRDDYRSIFVEQWSPYLGFMLLVFLAMTLMASGLFWGVFGGVKLWGDHLNKLIGLGPALGISENIKGPLEHQMSVMNIALLLGAFTAALMSMQFAIRKAPLSEYAYGAVGGSLMGIGAVLAGGCTTGGFFIPLTFSSPAGWAMWVGLLAGAFIGLKILLWGMENITWGMTAPKNKTPALKSYFPWLGAVIAIAVIWWGIAWLRQGDAYVGTLALMILTGFGIGFVMHRSRLCFARAIREPFMTAEGEMTKAMIVALVVGMLFGSVLLQKGTIDPYVAISTRFWLGSLIGGLVFGVGMVLAGGCASGSLWRIGEGHLKLVVALFFFAWVGSIASGVFGKLGLTSGELDLDFMDGMVEYSTLGFQAYLPDLLGGWGWTYVVMLAVMLIWWALVRYNESTERFTVI
ncbi:YeeE/YedE thiosulfate transporter family protein [Alisedimentitalea sp. MJ-SS2]|uniref:YeeE/YedE thiosulfate transporter family protein n=1 Tax=Aliisedimentitalea sp. MJ-SS2 TaxID=3049795 RepID=UPI00290CA95E|nr:YeeE/YedE thiosulfate transporter family protein [Alisedimentitalea sp. MJ-SS2]MDU8925780.1 YeeE/YedE thiosulfate transporter family protein [Alisedimentitalea sp. MJ-SS2]